MVSDIAHSRCSARTPGRAAGQAGAVGRLPNPPPDAYVSAMAIFPRPVSPRSALADLRDMFSPDRPHRWTLLALSCTLTGVLLWGLLLDSRIPPKEREIIYVESWMNDRKDSDIIREQMKDLAGYEAAFQKKQGEYQKMADMFGIEWRADAERNRIQREQVIAAIQKKLAERLAAAEAREAAAAAGHGKAAVAAR